MAEETKAGSLRCAGCGLVIPPEQVTVFECPKRRSDSIDHVLRAAGPIPTNAARLLSSPVTAGTNPFVHFRQLTTNYQRAMARGLSDEDYLEIVETLSEQLAAVNRAPRATPLQWDEELSTWIKSEAQFVSGSHKARHLIATAIEIAVDQKLRGIDKEEAPTWSIASCGNAGLAAATVAKASNVPLDVFVPTWAEEPVVARLKKLDVRLHFCDRLESDPPGDPCYHRLRESVAQGALPLSCQGGDNAFAIDGGKILAFELIAQNAGKAPITDLIVQTGGGALASSLAQGFSLAKQAGVIVNLPRLHAIQSEAVHPLYVAWQAWQKESDREPGWARTHRDHFMRPWEAPEGDEAASIASGILDDETYDWLAILEYIDEHGGSVFTVREEEFAEANRIANQREPVCMTGSAGLAGLQHLRTGGYDSPNPLILFTGTMR